MGAHGAILSLYKSLYPEGHTTTMNNPTFWSDLHKHYKTQDWIDKPSLFAAQAVEFFPSRGKLLELGAGLGQDSRFFAEYGYEVTSTDLEQTAMDIDKRKVSSDIKDRVEFKQLDMRQPFPFEDKSFDIVYSHLALHYFDSTTTQHVFDEIARVLRPGGILAFLVNSTSDPEYGTGSPIESDFYQVEHTSSAPNRSWHLPPRSRARSSTIMVRPIKTASRASTTWCVISVNVRTRY